MHSKRNSLKFRVCWPLLCYFGSCRRTKVNTTMFCLCNFVQFLKDKTTEFSLGLFTFDFKNALWSIRSQVDSETQCECKQAKRCTRMCDIITHTVFSGCVGRVCVTEVRVERTFQRSKVLTWTRLWWDRHSSAFWQKWQTPQQNVNTTLQPATFEEALLDKSANLSCCPFNPYRITENTFLKPI